MMFYVYIIECFGKRNKKFHYVGYTNNLIRRFHEHSSGKGARFLKGKTNLFVLSFEMFSDQKIAMRREIEIKRNKKLKHELIHQAKESERNDNDDMEI